MKLTSVLLITVTGLFLARPVLAGGVTSDKEAIALAERVMERIVVDDIDGTFDIVKPHSALEFGEFNAFSRQTSGAFKARPPGFGAPLGYAYVDHEALADTILRVFFIERFKNKPLGWEFFFYKPEKTWLLLGFQFFGDERLMFNLPPRIPLALQRGSPTSSGAPSVHP